MARLGPCGPRRSTMVGTTGGPRNAKVTDRLPETLSSGAPSRHQQADGGADQDRREDCSSSDFDAGQGCRLRRQRLRFRSYQRRDSYRQHVGFRRGAVVHARWTNQLVDDAEQFWRSVPGRPRWPAFGSAREKCLGAEQRVLDASPLGQREFDANVLIAIDRPVTSLPLPEVCPFATLKVGGNEFGSRGCREKLRPEPVCLIRMEQRHLHVDTETNVHPLAPRFAGDLQHVKEGWIGEPLRQEYDVALKKSVPPRVELEPELVAPGRTQLDDSGRGLVRGSPVRDVLLGRSGELVMAGQFVPVAVNDLERWTWIDGQRREWLRTEVGLPEPL